MLDKLYEIQKYLLDEMPLKGNVRKALDEITNLIDELSAEGEF